MKRRALISILIVAAMVSGIADWRLHNENRALAMRITERRARQAEFDRTAAENERLRHLLELSHSHQQNAETELHHETEQARREVESLEQNAQKRFVAVTTAEAAEAEALRTNRDLKKGLVLVENCANVGQSTPLEALQTVVWAGVHGQEAELARMISVSGAARMAGDAMIALLPEATRAKYPNPESLVVLYAEDTLKDIPALQVVEEKSTDPQHVVLMIRTANPRQSEIPMQLGPDGWQVDLSQAKYFERVKAQLLKVRR